MLMQGHIEARADYDTYLVNFKHMKIDGMRMEIRKMWFENGALVPLCEVILYRERRVHDMLGM